MSFLSFFCLLDGLLYTAATSNFLGTLFDISRATGPEQERIRTERSINWLSGKRHICPQSHMLTPHFPTRIIRTVCLRVFFLSDPEFVSSAFIEQSAGNPTGDDDKIYFFFNEVAKEYDFYTKVKVPRVARVCKVTQCLD